MENQDFEITKQRVIKAVATIAEAVVKLTLAIWENIKSSIRILYERINDAEHLYSLPKFVHPIKRDMRRKSQVISRKPLAFVRRMNM